MISSEVVATIFGASGFDPDRLKRMLTDVEGTASPVGAVVPQFRGQTFFDTNNKDYWVAVALTNADWKKLTP